MMRQFQTVKVFDTKCKTCGGPHSFTEYPAVDGYTQETAYATTGNYNSGGSLPGNTVPNPWANLKAITTRSGVTLAGPSVSPPPSKESSPASTSFSTISSSKMPEVTKDTVQPSTKNIQPSMTQTQILIYEPVVAPKPKPTIPYPSRVNKQKLHVYGEELTLRVDDEAIIFKVGQTSKYSYNDAESINRIDVIDVACEEYLQEVLGFSDNSKSGNPTLISDPIIALSSPSLTPFKGGDFILEVIEACLTNESIPPGIDDTDLDLEGDIRLLEELLNNNPSLSPLPLNELNVEEIKTVKSSIDEPSKLELKELPSHLEYAFLEGTSKLPVIIFKELKDEEKSAHLKMDFFGYFHIPIDLQEQEKTNFTCPYGTLAYRCMPFGLCNAPGTLQRCIMAIFHDMIEKTMEVFMDDFSVFGDSFSSCLPHLYKMLQRCEDTNLVLNWEKFHFMVQEGIVLGHKIFNFGIEVDRAKVNVIAKLPHPTSVKGAVLGQRKTKHFHPIHYASKTMTDAQVHYTTTENELPAVVYAFEKFRPYLVLSKTIVYTIYVIIRDKKGAENLAADHLSRLENPYQDELEKKEITEKFPLETLGMIAFFGDSSTPWFADFANYHAGNFIVKGMSSQQKEIH
nr:retrovirus-related Pol polyprotein from transposon 17.6 [Tanacetum cinerariifolium]